MLYKGLKGKARIPTDDLIPKNRRCSNQHSLAFQIPSASKEAYKSSFFPQTIRDWNDLPDSLISSAEMSDDCVSVRFTRTFKGLISPPSEPPGEIMSFGVSPVNYYIQIQTGYMNKRTLLDKNIGILNPFYTLYHTKTSPHMIKHYCAACQHAAIVE